MKRTAIWMMLLAAVIFTGCNKNDQPIETPKDKEPPSPTVTDAHKALIQSNNTFGINMFQQVNTGEDAGENIFISPLSISMALGMTMNGAEGNTEDAMKQALEFGNLTQTQINQTYRDILDNLSGLDPQVTLDIANSIWYKNTFQVKQDFFQTNQQSFDARIEALNFEDPNAKNTINQWVEDATNNKIQDMIGDISPDHVMFLVNAVYFKALWTYQFDPKNTTKQDFHKANESTVQVDMMFDENIPFGYYTDGDVQVAELPYGNGRFSLVVVLPANGQDVNTVASNLTYEKWEQWLAQVDTGHSLQLYLPKFELEYEVQLKDALSQMGMGVAFTDQADFTGISDARLQIDEVKHKTYVKLDEEGTEAAAATSVGVVVTSLPPAFNANRPFIFAIRENAYGSIVFIGKMMDPAAS